MNAHTPPTGATRDEAVEWDTHRRERLRRRVRRTPNPLGQAARKAAELTATVNVPLACALSDTAARNCGILIAASEPTRCGDGVSPAADELHAYQHGAEQRVSRGYELTLGLACRERHVPWRMEQPALHERRHELADRVLPLQRSALRRWQAVWIINVGQRLVHRSDSDGLRSCGGCGAAAYL